MKKVNYKEYISSREWLLKKNELFSIYIKQGWEICCDICGETHNLTVHHNSYSQLGDENLKDDGSGDIFNLDILCWTCHKKLHSDKNFKENAQNLRFLRAMEVISNLKK